MGISLTVKTYIPNTCDGYIYRRNIRRASLGGRRTRAYIRKIRDSSPFKKRQLGPSTLSQRV